MYCNWRDQINNKLSRIYSIYRFETRKNTVKSFMIMRTTSEVRPER